MNFQKQAKAINKKLFSNKLNMDNVEIHCEKKLLINGECIAGITMAFKTNKGERLSKIYLFSKYLKHTDKEYKINVLAHEMVHAYQNQLKQKLNHNGAFFTYYERKARRFGYEIDMARF